MPSDAAPADWPSRIAALAPVVAAHRAALETERHLPTPLFNAMAGAGLFRLWLPRGLGGPELSPADFMAVVEAVAALDGSVGWVLGNGAGMSRAGGYLPEAYAREIFAHPRAFIVSSTGAVGDAVPAPGGYRVSGRWIFGSGIHNASHAMVLCRVADGRATDAPVTQLACYFPIEHATIIDNWFVSGLRGTGSCDFTVRDLFVPAGQVHAFPGITPTQPGIVYRLPALTAFSWTVATVPLGIARGAMDAFARFASAGGRSGATSVLRERETAQAGFGRLMTQYQAARALLLATMQAVMAALEAGPDALLGARLDFRLACINAAETACRIVEALAGMAGTAALMETGVLERYLRDAHAASRHRAMSADLYAVGGRVGLGMAPETDRI